MEEIQEMTDQADSSPDFQQAEIPAGDLHTVTIDGADQQVSLDELRNGYQRQADYTRKTQELASERERLAQGEAIVQALEADPQGAISALAGAFGVSGGNQDTITTQQEVDCEDLDPDEIRLRRIEQSIEEQNRANRQQNLQKEVISLKEKYGVDFDEKALYSHALKNKINNLEAAFTHMKWDNKQASNRDAEIVEEKRRASQLVETTPGTADGNVERAAKAVSSIREAFTLANEQLSNN